MLAEAQPYMRRVPSLTPIPGAAIFVTALSVTLLRQSLMLRTQMRAWPGAAHLSAHLTLFGGNDNGLSD